MDIDDILNGSQPALKEGEGTATSSAAPKPLPSTAAISETAVFTGEFSWPLKGSILTSFGSGVGGQRNEGIDIKAPKGTPVLAAADGVVAYAGDEIKLFGGLVLITHGRGWVTAYGHEASLHVVRGKKIGRAYV